MRDRLVYRIAVLLAAIHASAVAVAREPWIDFQVISDLDFRSSKPIYTAIHSQDELIALRNSEDGHSLNDTLTAKPDPKALVDFQKYELLIASSGTKPNSGYSLAFTSVRDVGVEVLVSVLDIGPGVSCPTAQEISHPRIFALIPKSDKRVTFSVSRATVECNTREGFH